MYNINYDSDKHILFLSVEGYLDSDEISRLAEDFGKQVNSLDEGFCFVNDMSGFNPPSDNVFLIIKEFMELLDSKKPGKVIRILDPDNTGALVQFFQSDEVASVDYEVVTVSSREEAMTLLEK
jgi:hypothetical protein